MSNKIKVWDLPLRLFHWLMVLTVIAAYVTVQQGGNMMAYHKWCGIVLIGLLGFRLCWGVCGSRTARFSQFIKGPKAIKAYLNGHWQGIGHNPLGALSVIAMLVMFGFQAISGLFANDDIAFSGPLASLVDYETSGQITGLHSRMEWVLLGLVALHVLAIVYYSRVKKDNLVKPMITGWKAAKAERTMREQENNTGGVIALCISIVFGVVAAWLAAGGAMPPPPPSPATPDW